MILLPLYGKNWGATWVYFTPNPFRHPALFLMIIKNDPQLGLLVRKQMNKDPKKK